MTWNRVAIVLTFLAAATCLCLAGARLYLFVDLGLPSLVITSGCEEEALFSLWKHGQGLPVYTDGVSSPYAVSYFNFLFYGIYGGWTEAGLRLFAVDSAWLPTVARVLTLILLLLSVLTFCRLARAAEIVPISWALPTLAAAATLPFFAPILRYWLLTARPDAGAVLLELLGLLWVIRYERDGGWPRLLFACLLLYAAWAFKHSAITVAGAYCLWSLLRWRWRPVLVVGAVLASAFAATLALGSTDYRWSILLSQRHMDVSPAQGVALFTQAVKDNPMLGMAILAGGVGLFRRWSAIKDRPLGLILVCFLVSLLWAGVTSMKAGASTNYYYLLAALGVLSLLGLMREEGADAGPMTVAWCAGCGLLIVTAFGAAWHLPAEATDLRAERDKWISLRENLKSMPGPVLVAERAGNLPWLQPGAPHFVVGTAYPYHWRAGVPFQGGGLAGWVKEKRLGTLVLRAGSPASFDGLPLEGYELKRQDANFRYYVRISDGSSTHYQQAAPSAVPGSIRSNAP